jgi:predicted transcriptional regulator
MSRPISELRSSMTAKERAAAARDADVLRAELAATENTLQALRKAYRFSQVKIAQEMGLEQSAVSRLESQDDMLLSTLRRYIEALGGELELIARFGKTTVRLK